MRAQNKWGWGEYSSLRTITSSTWPATVSTPVTSIVAADGNVLVTWAKPDERSAVVSKYKVEF